MSVKLTTRSTWKPQTYTKADDPAKFLQLPLAQNGKFTFKNAWVHTVIWSASNSNHWKT